MLKFRQTRYSTPYSVRFNIKKYQNNYFGLFYLKNNSYVEVMVA